MEQQKMVYLSNVLPVFTLVFPMLHKKIVELLTYAMTFKHVLFYTHFLNEFVSYGYIERCCNSVHFIEITFNILIYSTLNVMFICSLSCHVLPSAGIFYWCWQYLYVNYKAAIKN